MLSDAFSGNSRESHTLLSMFTRISCDKLKPMIAVEENVFEMTRTMRVILSVVNRESNL